MKQESERSTKTKEMKRERVSKDIIDEVSFIESMEMRMVIRLELKLFKMNQDSFWSHQSPWGYFMEVFVDELKVKEPMAEVESHIKDQKLHNKEKDWLWNGREALNVDFEPILFWNEHIIQRNVERPHDINVKEG